VITSSGTELITSLGVEFLTDDPAICEPNPAPSAGLGPDLTPWLSDDCYDITITNITKISNTPNSITYEYGLSQATATCALVALITEV